MSKGLQKEIKQGFSNGQRGTGKAKYSITVTVLLALPRKTWEDKSFKEVTVTVPLVFPRETWEGIDLTVLGSRSIPEKLGNSAEHSQ